MIKADRVSLMTKVGRQDTKTSLPTARSWPEVIYRKSFSNLLKPRDEAKAKPMIVKQLAQQSQGAAVQAEVHRLMELNQG
jgi:hypothetical protein